jgi:hypothetical protein
MVNLAESINTANHSELSTEVIKKKQQIKGYLEDKSSFSTVTNIMLVIAVLGAIYLLKKVKSQLGL